MKKKIIVSVIALLSVVVLLVIGTGCHDYFSSVSKNGQYVDVKFKKAPTTGYHLYVYTSSLEDYDQHTTTKSNQLTYSFYLSKSGTGAIVKYCDKNGNELDSWIKN